MKILFRIFTVILFPILILSVCGKLNKDESEEIILAKVGEKTISLNEFIRRAEYTIRPSYCKGNTNIHKKIILNSLIAEKMFSSEAGADNELLKNEKFQRYLRGRKEQAMRQWLYHKQLYEKIKIDPARTKKVFQLAGRKYRVQYFSMSNIDLATEVAAQLQKDGATFEDVYFELSGTDSIPSREVAWQANESGAIQDALFSDTIQVGQVIGPLRAEDNSFIVMKIKGWTERLAISDRDIKQRWQDVTEQLTREEAVKYFAQYAGNLMKGKRIVFSKTMYKKIVEVFAPVYLSSAKEKKELFLHSVFNKEVGDSANIVQNLDNTLENNRDEPLYELDGQVVTVGEFARDLDMHPLVFRKKRIGKADFAEQLKLAIVDMVRDKFITQDAYKRGYDKAVAVKRVVSMWQDALVALYQKYKYLDGKKLEDKSDLQIINDILNPYIDTLQKKYSYIIEIDVDHFNEIQLSHIDLFAMQENVPYPVIVPSFPQLTTDPWLDYGKKMK